MTDERRNAEHYMDMTAYTAIRNAEREMGMYPKAGEIWVIDKNGKESVVAVVSAHENHCTVLLLTDQQKRGNSIKITVRTPMYTDPSMLSYQYHTYFDRMIYTLPGGEFADLLGAVADALCVKTDDQSDELEAKQAEIDSLKDLCEEYGDKLSILRAEVDRLEIELEIESDKLRQSGTSDTATLKAERDVYKSLYEQTIEKLIADRKGA